jgi:D-glycero-D-manno-heptose 1,7-bisphosphate phosphatase
MNRALFLDRDGTLIEEKHYLHRVEDVVFIPGAAEGLAKLQNAGFKLIVVTNQAGVGRGYYPIEDVHKVHQFLVQELHSHGVQFEKFYIAPEAPSQPSRGRKPSPQFLLDARDEFGIDLSKSYFVGDKMVDLECGWNAGVRKSILVRTGYGRELEGKKEPALAKAVVVDDLPAAANWILANDL